jgi:GT2 family glycosyltransferase
VVLIVNPDAALSSGSEAGIQRAFEDSSVTHATGLSAQTRRPFLCHFTPNWYELLRYSVFTLVHRWFPIAALLRPVTRRWGQFVSGALLAVRCTTWRTAGGFYEDYFLYYEDRDFGERLLAHGRMEVIDDLCASHDQGTGSSGKPFGFSMHAGLSGWLLYTAKKQGAVAARRWCSRMAGTQRLLATLLAPSCDGRKSAPVGPIYRHPAS